MLSQTSSVSKARMALAIGTSLIRLLTHALDIASVSTDLAVLIGLGVGVDYGLFIISRHRSAVRAGRSYSDAAAEAVTTSGRTVLFAGLTVCWWAWPPSRRWP
jgi:RND superfamily putative drug exporter